MARLRLATLPFRLIADPDLVGTLPPTLSAGSKAKSDRWRHRARRDRPFEQDRSLSRRHTGLSQAFLEPVLDIRVLVKAGHLSVAEPGVHRPSFD